MFTHRNEMDGIVKRSQWSVQGTGSLGVLLRWLPLGISASGFIIHAIFFFFNIFSFGRRQYASESVSSHNVCLSQCDDYVKSKKWSNHKAR